MQLHWCNEDESTNMWANTFASRNYNIIGNCVHYFVVGNKNILRHNVQYYGLPNERLALKLFSILHLLWLGCGMCLLFCNNLLK